MPRLLPPSPQRVRDARALGLRPRSRLLVIAGFALLVRALLECLPLAAASLSNQLELGFAGPPTLTSPISAASCAAVLLALLGAGLVAAFGLAPRARARRALAVGPEAEVVPAAIAVVLSLACLGLGVVAGLPVLAGAARSVDAGPDALALVWVAWASRGLLALALIAGGVGMIERLVSAQSLWRALHLSRTQVREQARAAGRR